MADPDPQTDHAMAPLHRLVETETTKCQVWLLADTKTTHVHLQITYTQSITIPLAEVCRWGGKKETCSGVSK